MRNSGERMSRSGGEGPNKVVFLKIKVSIMLIGNMIAMNVKLHTGIYKCVANV